MYIYLYTITKLFPSIYIHIIRSLLYFHQFKTQYIYIYVYMKSHSLYPNTAGVGIGEKYTNCYYCAARNSR